MQPDGNSFCEDVVLESFNMAYRDEGRILFRMYEDQIFWDLYYEDLEFFSDLRKCIL